MATTRNASRMRIGSATGAEWGLRKKLQTRGQADIPKKVVVFPGKVHERLAFVAKHRHIWLAAWPCCALDVFLTASMPAEPQPQQSSSSRSARRPTTASNYAGVIIRRSNHIYACKAEIPSLDRPNIYFCSASNFLTTFNVLPMAAANSLLSSFCRSCAAFSQRRRIAKTSW